MVVEVWIRKNALQRRDKACKYGESEDKVQVKFLGQKDLVVGCDFINAGGGYQGEKGLQVGGGFLDYLREFAMKISYPVIFMSVGACGFKFSIQKEFDAGGGWGNMWLYLILFQKFPFAGIF